MLSRSSFYLLTSPLFQIILTSFFLSACGSGGGSKAETQAPESNKGFSTSAVHASDFESSPLCPGGGVEIHTGVDVNQNGLLDTDEINGTQELCHLESDRIMAVVEPLLVDSECPFSGNRLKIGYDQNKNDVIDAAEVNQSLLLCHQQALTQLAMAVFSFDEEPEGINCTYGGTRQSVGIDRNNNGLLDNAEITSSQYQCTTNLPVRPVYYSSYCEDINCEEIIDQQLRYLLIGDSEAAFLGNFFDDGVGNISLMPDVSAPEWLSLSLYRQDYYNGIYTYNILVDQASIPPEAAGLEFDVRITISDGEHQFDLLKKLKVIRPVRVTLSADELSVTEPGLDKEQAKFIKVLFDTPLPADLDYYPGSNYLTDRMLQVFSVSGEDLSYISKDNDDFSVKWLGDSLYPGQTEATIMLLIKDDLLPESDENYRIQIKKTYFDANPELRFLVDNIDFSILDDADQAISASIEFDTTEIIEGTLTDNSSPVSVGFTIKFDQPLPSNAYINLQVSSLDAANYSSSNNRDIGFDNNCYKLDYYCNRSVYLSLTKGLTEYTSTLKIRSDHDFEQNERFELKVVNQNSSFKLNETRTILTILDDDSQPEISFEETKQQRFYKDALAYLPVKLSATSFEAITFSLDLNSASTMLEGVHFDFGLSMPVTLQKGRSEFEVPILLYGEAFEADSLEAIFDINVIQGASVSSESGSHTLVLDKISPFRLNGSNLVIPLSEGQITTSHIYMDEHFNFYKTGRINGVISGEISAGDDDLFVAKFDSEQKLIWARQFGSSQYDGLSRSVFDKRSKQMIISSSRDSLYVVTASGELKNLTTHFDNIYFGLVDAKSDSQGNLYISGVKSSSVDLDGDGYRTTYVLMKFNNQHELQWFQEDFSDLSDMTNTHYNPSDLHLELTESGVPFLFGSAYLSSFNGDSQIGSNDYFVTRLDPASGVLTNGHLFGSDGYDNTSLHISAFGMDQVIIFYNIDSGDTVGAHTAQQLQAVKVLIDENGDIQDESFVVHTVGAYGVRSFRKASDASFFMIEGAYYNSAYYSKHFDAQFNLIHSQKILYDTNTNIMDFFVKDPVQAQDGGYYLGSENSIIKIAPDLRIRN